MSLKIGGEAIVWLPSPLVGELQVCSVFHANFLFIIPESCSSSEILFLYELDKSISIVIN